MVSGKTTTFAKQSRVHRMGWRSSIREVLDSILRSVTVCRYNTLVVFTQSLHAVWQYHHSPLPNHHSSSVYHPTIQSCTVIWLKRRKTTHKGGITFINCSPWNRPNVTAKMFKSQYRPLTNFLELGPSRDRGHIIIIVIIIETSSLYWAHLNRFHNISITILSIINRRVFCLKRFGDWILCPSWDRT
jgi:hypothetical protein